MVVIRLAPGGKKHSPVYRIHVADRDYKLRGRFLERLGTYKPGKTSGFFTLDQERYQHWISKGAQPTETLKKLVRINKATASAAATPTTPAAATK